MGTIESRDHAGAGQQPETASGTGQTDRQAGLARNSQEVVSSAGAPHGKEPSDQRDSVIDPSGSTGLLERPKNLQPKKTGSESPFLNMLVGRGMAITLALELAKENEHLHSEIEVFAEKDKKRREQNTKATIRYQKKVAEQDPEKARKIWAEKKARYRERKRQQAESESA
jgi:hypothetical protein